MAVSSISVNVIYWVLPFASFVPTDTEKFFNSIPQSVFNGLTLILSLNNKVLRGQTRVKLILYFHHAQHRTLHIIKYYVNELMPYHHNSVNVRSLSPRTKMYNIQENISFSLVFQEADFTDLISQPQECLLLVTSSFVSLPWELPCRSMCMSLL